MRYSSAPPQELAAMPQHQSHVEHQQPPSLPPQSPPEPQAAPDMTFVEPSTNHNEEWAYSGKSRHAATCLQPDQRANYATIGNEAAATRLQRASSLSTVRCAWGTDHQSPGFRQSLSSLAQKRATGETTQVPSRPRLGQIHLQTDGQASNSNNSSSSSNSKSELSDWRSYRPATKSNHRDEDTNLIRAIHHSHDTIYWRPAVSERSSKSEYVLEVLLPGTDPLDVGLTFYPADPDAGSEQSSLVISGHTDVNPRMQRRGLDDECWYERFTGPFERVIRFDEAIEAASIAVSFSHGVATVVLPKSTGTRGEHVTCPYMMVWEEGGTYCVFGAQGSSHAGADAVADAGADSAHPDSEMHQPTHAVAGPVFGND